MAGNQASSMSKGDFVRYKVRDKNSAPSAVYCNLVKSWMEQHMSKEVAQWEKHFGEKEWWDIVRKEMFQYSFGFEGNQALYLYHKYKKVLK